jgi:hypothetical protein
VGGGHFCFSYKENISRLSLLLSKPSLFYLQKKRKMKLRRNILLK